MNTTGYLPLLPSILSKKSLHVYNFREGLFKILNTEK